MIFNGIYVCIIRVFIFHNLNRFCSVPLWLRASSYWPSRSNFYILLFIRLFRLLKFQFNLLNDPKIDLRIFVVYMLSFYHCSSLKHMKIVHILCLVISEMYAWMDQIFSVVILFFAPSFLRFCFFFSPILLDLSSIFPPTHRFVVFPGISSRFSVSRYVYHHLITLYPRVSIVYTLCGCCVCVF